MKKITVLLLAIIIVLACTACGNKSDPSPVSNAGFQLENASADIALILGAHSNRYHIANYLDPHVENISKPIQFGGSVTLIANDQAPSPMTIQYAKIDASMSKYQQDQKKTEEVKKIIAKAVTAKADDAETDMVKCLAAAASGLRQGNAPQKLIVIIDSGVASTAGEINLTTSLPILEDVDTETIMNHLEKQGTFNKSYVDLSDVTVVWSSFACTSAPQEDLSGKAVERLSSFWKAVLYRLGAKDVIIDTNYGGQKAYTDLPSVTPLTIPAVDNLDKPIITEVVLRETLLFVPDSTSEYLRPDEAGRTLDEVASILAANHQSILIAGSIATVESPDKGVSFSKARADRVKAELVSRGIPAERLTTIGLGYIGPKHVNDLSPDGSLNEQQAVYNRNITLYDLDSKEAQGLLHAVQE